MTPDATVPPRLAQGSLRGSPTRGAWWMNSGGQDRAGAPFAMFSDWSAAPCAVVCSASFMPGLPG